MQTANQLEQVSVQDYLERELASDIRHEYIGGLVYAMAGASRGHNALAGNIFAALHSHLRSKPCRPFMSGLKVRLEVLNADIFYYPDIIVACDLRDTDRYFIQNPKVVIEVLSETTEAIDRREKFMSYTQIASLEEYVLVAQDRMEVTVFRRADNWRPALLARPEQPLKLPSLDFSLPVRVIYEGVPVSPATP